MKRKGRSERKKKEKRKEVEKKKKKCNTNDQCNKSGQKDDQSFRKRLVRVADWLDHLITAAFYYVMTVQGMQTVYIMNSIDAARQGLQYRAWVQSPMLHCFKVSLHAYCLFWACTITFFLMYDICFNQCTVIIFLYGNCCYQYMETIILLSI